MIEIKRLNDTHQAIWDSYVDQCDEATPYHRFAWGQAVKASYGFDTHYLGAFEGDTLVGVLPLIKMQSPLGKAYYVSLPYCDCAGAIADDLKIKESLLEYASTTLSVKQNTSLVLRDGTYESSLTEQIDENAKVRMILELESTVDEQMSAFKSKLRSQIRKAEKNGLTTTVTQFQMSDAFKRQFAGFYHVISSNMRALGSPVHSTSWFFEILKAYDKNAYLSLVYKDEEIIGGAIVLMNGDKGSIPWASTLSEYNRLAPNMLLYWSVLSYAIESDMKSFDFGRSTINEGTYKFKKQWGCEPTQLNWSELVAGKAVENEDMNKSTARKVVEQLWCKTPLSLTNLLGPRIRKYISL
ncbi:MAG: GNAT family N-acetyltransferase [Glaciecola sp.]|jgi:FemAB-related protein (PEP-CTERM system-associated)